MQTLKARLTGMSPLLFNPHVEEVKKDWKGFWPPKDVQQKMADMRVPKDEEGKIGIPANMILAALVYAGQFVPYEGTGNKQFLTMSSKSSLVPGLVFLNSPFFPFVDQDVKPQPDARSGSQTQGKGKGGGVPIIRPRFDAWAIDVEARYDDEDIKSEQLRRLFKCAGTRAGLGSHRASSSGGGMGSFEVTKWNDGQSSAQAA